jgi:transcriptional regulator with XRE-family HTH domain
MYSNLRAEIARKNLTLEKIVEKLKERDINITVSMLSQKLNGKYEIYLKEAKALKEIVETDLPLDILFEEAG